MTGENPDEPAYRRRQSGEVDPANRRSAHGCPGPCPAGRRSGALAATESPEEWRTRRRSLLADSLQRVQADFANYRNERCTTSNWQLMLAVARCHYGARRSDRRAIIRRPRFRTVKSVAGC